MLKARAYGIPVTLEKVIQDGEDVWLMVGKTWVGDWTMRFLMFMNSLFGSGLKITDIEENKCTIRH